MKATTIQRTSAQEIIGLNLPQTLFEGFQGLLSVQDGGASWSIELGPSCSLSGLSSPPPLSSISNLTSRVERVPEIEESDSSMGDDLHQSSLDPSAPISR
ncbi:hypothetical protein PGT21_018077 [Puccinia graminis f. sp. tritici]|uniref:Uncharacterized protein n=1 Tax=Puccinia graminis f. sp. tritici TaxID=56615 RepID=A0A5B0QTH4_PUCGR|nr:hypothetical protein PGT21_018077 [Puccinia graminis f. sp. tritici]KAA1121800.1 hypothetical protein PGTUg99_030375 [Puccinia graminis f. sp. tritici]